MAEQSLGFPQLILIFIIGGLTIRYFFFPSSASSTNRGSNHANDLNTRERDVRRIQQMFPQIPRRSIIWDLQRNGGNITATTERILSGRGLEIPPQSFQPSLPATSPPSTSESSTRSRTSRSQPDLITRYNLKSKVAEESKSSDESTDLSQKQGQAWSSNKIERQAILKKRREEMILAARRKMEAKIAAESSNS
ncbi:Coupling of ubiquitin conjugation to ER degradation protein 1 [Golovinomyces cichoracearum]|uniref:Coupling of ubiquitin conjugation to ER degradation protein 1 n=1 Tax=Golovinomyces cichoracearum TaxID=62708 RepID=A0A420IBH5_9PEZI|nr:Coupling of ubiquitin conjugation to ER degradation protein 1 [Golovinomyces cichoracearum]